MTPLCLLAFTLSAGNVKTATELFHTFIELFQLQSNRSDLSEILQWFLSLTFVVTIWHLLAYLNTERPFLKAMGVYI